MQISNIIHQKNNIMESFRDGGSMDIKYLCPCNMPNPDIDQHVWETF